ncbi:MAG: trypsin-like serine protease [Planctomycetes bacterium]|nr:trypsin-like serine protease [Planctomycetota bacterium]
MNTHENKFDLFARQEFQMSVFERTLLKGRVVRTGAFLALLLFICTVSPLGAQPIDVRYSRIALDFDSAVHDGMPEIRIAYQDTIVVPDVPWMRLRIADYHLGENSYIILRSSLDGGEQRLDAGSLPVWENATAIFNGDSVEVELHVAPGDSGVFVQFDEVIAGDPALFEAQTICGSADNRIDSTDNRVGRLYFGGCTAWFITNGAFLTAGHCVDTNRDANGNPAPDGVLDLSGVVEFNIPGSTANGQTVAANPNDQFPILTNTVVWSYDAVNTIGEDWAVFQVGANSNTGLMPWRAYNTIGLRPSRENPAANDSIRITGCGLDNRPSGTGGFGAPCCTRDSNGNCTFDCNSDNFTLQRHSGPYVQQIVDSSNDISLHYRTDTTGGNSGSPIIWRTPAPDVAIGIHTNAGCTSTGGANQGTAFEVNVLETAVRNVTSTLARFVDVGHPFAVTLGNGTILRPFDTVTEAVTAVVNNGVISIVAGNYTAVAGNTFTAGADGKAMRLVTLVGTVTIGQ